MKSQSKKQLVITKSSRYFNPILCLDAEACAEKCVKEQTYLCKSFDVDNVRRACYLFSVDHEDTDVYFVDDANVDHYQSESFCVYWKKGLFLPFLVRETI